MLNWLRELLNPILTLPAPPPEVTQWIEIVGTLATLVTAIAAIVIASRQARIAKSDLELVERQTTLTEILTRIERSRDEPKLVAIEPSWEPIPEKPGSARLSFTLLNLREALALDVYLHCITIIGEHNDPAPWPYPVEVIPLHLEVGLVRNRCKIVVDVQRSKWRVAPGSPKLDISVLIGLCASASNPIIEIDFKPIVFSYMNVQALKTRSYVVRIWDRDQIDYFDKNYGLVYSLADNPDFDTSKVTIVSCLVD